MNVSQVTQDILNNPRFEGAIDSITWLTDWIDVGFGMAITVVAFLIILVAMFKNVLAAAYCAYPKFWNKVHEAHENHKEENAIGMTFAMLTGTVQNKSINNINGSTIGQIVMSCIPDIKGMTDFEADTLSAKTYFMKAIPQMLICIVMGAFIYNGYYRDVASLVVDTGSEMLSRTLLEFDPIAMYDQFTGTAGRPTFMSDGSVDDKGKLQNKLATTYYTSIIGSYKDITSAEAKRVLADACDAAAMDVINQLEASSAGVDYTNATKWKPTISTSWSSAAQDVSNRIGVVTNNKTGVKGFQFAHCLNVGSMGFSTIESHPEAAFILTRIVFEEMNVVSGSVSYRDLVWYVSANDMSNGVTVNTTVNGKVAHFKSLPTSNAVAGTKMNVTSDKAGVYKLAASVDKDKALQLQNPLTLCTYDEQGVKTEHTVTHIYFASSGDVNRFERVNGANVLKGGQEVKSFTPNDTGIGTAGTSEPVVKEEPKPEGEGGT